MVGLYFIKCKVNSLFNLLSIFFTVIKSQLDIEKGKHKNRSTFKQGKAT